MFKKFSIAVMCIVVLLSIAACGPDTTSTADSTEAPTSVPTEKPTAAPTEKPTAAPTEAPTSVPTEKPTAAPTEKPTAAPTEPTATPTEPTENTSVRTQQRLRYRQMACLTQRMLFVSLSMHIMVVVRGAMFPLKI